MKNFFIFLIFLSSCKSSQPTITEVAPQNKMLDCLLILLPKTRNYDQEIEKYTTIYKDTTIQLESAKNGSEEYITMLELRPSERYLWLLKTKGIDVDSLLIHSIAPSESVDSEFDIDHCKIEIQTTAFDKDGNPINTSAKFIDF